MRNKFLAVFFLITAVGLQATESNLIVSDCVKENRGEEPSEKLLDVTHRFIDFVNRISQREVFSYSEVAASLLAPNCQKSFNGNLYTESRDDYIADLLEVNRVYGNWRVEPLDIIISPINRCAVVRLMIDMEKFGTFTAIAILRFNEDYQVFEINEVLSRVESSYNFDENSQ